MNNFFTTYTYNKITTTLLILTLLSAVFGCGRGGGGIGGGGEGMGSNSSNGSSSDLLGGSISINWDAPSTNEDGTPLYDLAGYKVYCSTSSSNLISSPPIYVGNTTAYTINNLPSAVYYCAVTAYDYSGNESAFSNIVEKYVN